jgi:tetratricopeptide (TPR) repeat protein
MDPRFQNLESQKQRAGGFLTVALGDSRRMFANHFFVKADAYFHSGFYPTIFDNQESFQTPHVAEDAGALKGHNQGEETGFMGQPRDIIEEFNRHFLPSRHTHLDEGGPRGPAGTDLGEGGSGEVREILPWLRLSAEMDPGRIETYVVAAYWLRKKMGKVNEAEQFLREGLQANPGNSAILFELGRIYQEDRKDIGRARNVWELGVKKWDQQTTPKTEQDNFVLAQLTVHLARLEEDQGNLAAALQWLERAGPVSPDQEVIRKQIEELRQKLAESKAGTVPPPAKTQSQRP